MNLTISLFGGRKQIKYMEDKQAILLAEIANLRNDRNIWIDRYFEAVAATQSALTASATAVNDGDAACNTAKPSRLSETDELVASESSRLGRTRTPGPLLDYLPDPEYRQRDVLRPNGIDPIAWREWEDSLDTDHPFTPEIRDLIARLHAAMALRPIEKPTHFSGMFWLGADADRPEPTTDEILRRGLGDTPISAK